MAVKNTAKVIIGGKIITLGGYESEEYFQKVASYINKKMDELSAMPGYSRQPMETKHTLLGVEIDEKGAAEIAKRSRGTPRLANRLLKRVRDFAQVKYDGRITYDVACFALNLLEVDQYGLDKIDRRILQTMIVNFQGGPVGLETLAAAIGEDSGTLEDVYEPYLLQNGFLNRTPRGRMASALAYEHLGYQMPEKN